MRIPVKLVVMPVWVFFFMWVTEPLSPIRTGILAGMAALAWLFPGVGDDAGDDE